MRHFILTTFTAHKIKRLFISETIGRFLGFLIGLSSTKLFTYTVLEERKLKNLFGLLPRKHIVVHRTPHWVELLFAILVGFIAMELFYYLFQLINTKSTWRKTLRLYIMLTQKPAFAFLKRQSRKKRIPVV
jgi:cadmium resistance protein CadD (predicted permease)